MTNKIEVLPSQNLADNGSVVFNVPYMNSALGVSAFVFGTWGGGTAKLEYSVDGTNWVDSGHVGITGDYALTMAGKPCTKVRVVLTGATAPDLDVTVAI